MENEHQSALEVEQNNSSVAMIDMVLNLKAGDYASFVGEGSGQNLYKFFGQTTHAEAKSLILEALADKVVLQYLNGLSFDVDVAVNRIVSFIEFLEMQIEIYARRQETPSLDPDEIVKNWAKKYGENARADLRKQVQEKLGITGDNENDE
ncbi:MAG: hypothetical protein COT81_04110 [Candidatus Buchananbacteria bacterium CG10_big_fil_rev_8_21_14_0_10_42_9]|uniref:Uncharacterized protein n=1 Tax=Candidatus Buchananbacteria bacterium CG10_big_fil_rev_8_21_14_0_10_42_9 TaxID=1974526 RepID=A0A2H0W0J9_9BACT|nr:MAG: hypothetical protein COT81_04110 [Candidatus Buchananbacteria bacterium CG10_big_fil_rev_8_21_14_0_10_42_9]